MTISSDDDFAAAEYALGTLDASERRQREGQLDQKSDYGGQAPWYASEQVAERDAADGDDESGDGSTADRNRARIEESAAVDVMPIGPPSLCDSGDERCNEIKREKRGKTGKRRGNAARHCVPAASARMSAGALLDSPDRDAWRRVSPCFARIRRPLRPSRNATNRRAPAALGAPRRIVTV